MVDVRCLDGLPYSVQENALCPVPPPGGAGFLPLSTTSPSGKEQLVAVFVGVIH